jgi:hypothetical protein
MGDYWQLTVDVLQAPDNPIVDKPKLVEKYLTKPPFRYLHDIVTAVGVHPEAKPIGSIGLALTLTSPCALAGSK